ncbi:hypothetical protein FE257_000774 [Aspergillus nanangensis]|uniref:Uncharacterized protein n=1 Tax=Aspergillus nanangensis TaxID=2582783 RepID=A0AAD4GR47_ASPNN|nr:hypothetical protein FE257_000774 [Aspergillus nanangensis]
MKPFKKLWDSFTGLADVKRRSSPVQAIPGACSLSCKAALVEAESSSLSPKTCEETSTFQRLLQGCTRCIEEENIARQNAYWIFGTTGENHDETMETLEQFIAYCAPINQDSEAASITSLLSARAHLTARAYGLERRVSDDMSFYSDASFYSESTSLGGTTTTTSEAITRQPTLTLTSSAGSSSTLITLYATAGASPPASNGPQLNVIIPAVVVPVVFIIAVAVVGVLYLRRRWKQKPATPTQPPQETDDAGKSELHADAFRPELHGGSDPLPVKKENKPSEMAELPAHEPVGSEMHGG